MARRVPQARAAGACRKCYEGCRRILILMLDRLPQAALAAVVGWCLGWGSAWLTAWLQRSDDPDHPADPALAPLRWNVLVRDAMVQGALALVWAALALFLAGDWLRWAAAGLLSVPLVQVAVTDFRTRYVYTVIAWLGLALGLAFGWQVHGTAWWTSVAGAAAGFAFLGFFYLLGKLYVRVRNLQDVEAMASGDVTIAAMVGAGSAACTPSALFVGMLMGGFLALGVWIVRRSASGTMPFGPGLCLGGLATLFWC
jgi:prepilin signal peptidase PulO-like enzyme (type II secretory pathway)